MRSHLFCLIMVSVMAASCRHNQNSAVLSYADADTITIDFENGNYVQFDSIFDYVKIVRLETKKESLVSEVQQIICMDSTILVIDKIYSKRIQIFDYSGHHVRQVSRLGNGPREYLDLSFVFKVSDSIFALQDRVKRVISFYSSKGEFLYESPLPTVGGDMMLLDGKYYVHDTWGVGHISPSDKGNKSMFVVTDTLYKRRYSVGADSFSRRKNVGQMFHLYNFHGDVYGMPNMGMEIYQFSADSARVKYVLNFKRRSVGDFNYSSSEEYYELCKEYPHFQGNFIDFDRFLYLSVNLNSTIGTNMIYNKESKRLSTLVMKSSSALVSCFFKPLITDLEDAMVTLQSPVSLLYKKDLLFSTGSTPQLEELYSELKPDDNPVLFFYHLRENR